MEMEVFESNYAEKAKVVYPTTEDKMVEATEFRQ